MEQYIFDNGILGDDLTLLQRQVRHGGKKGRPDIIGVDAEGCVCIIELKNVPVGDEVVPQVLGYALWAQRNPDSIKSLWLEADDRPDEVEPAWDTPEVRIIIVAPSFAPGLEGVAAKIAYPVELVSVRRFNRRSNEFIIIDRQEADAGEAVHAAVGLRSYDRAFYERERGKEATTRFLVAVAELGRIAKSQGWRLEEKKNKNYVGFKRDGRILFGVQWRGRASRLFVKIPLEVAARAKVPRGWRRLAYVTQFKQAMYAPEDNRPLRMSTVRHLLRLAWKESERA